MQKRRSFERLCPFSLSTSLVLYFTKLIISQAPTLVKLFFSALLFYKACLTLQLILFSDIVGVKDTPDAQDTNKK